VVAWLAFVLSMVALGWQLLQWYINWPRIGVLTRQSAYFHLNFGGSADPQKATDKVHVVVVNGGAEAASIANVGLRSADKTIRMDVETLRGNGKKIEGPDLPTRVEGHGALHWTFDSEFLEQFPRGTEVIGYAMRYRAFRKYPPWQRNPLRIIDAVVPFIKS
jgi:hypothetical protein